MEKIAPTKKYEVQRCNPYTKYKRERLNRRRKENKKIEINK
jgi:hypothetical protein